MTSAPFILGICSDPWLRNAGASHADVAFFKLRQCESDFNHIGWGGQYRGPSGGSSAPSPTLLQRTDQHPPEIHECPEVFLFGAIWLLTLRKEISAVSSI
jgi:hypothetical protein